MIMRRSIKEGRGEEWYKNGRLSGKSMEWLWVFFFSPMPPPVLMNFVVFPPGCSYSAADF
jgi:hypothetical protein